MRYDMVQGDLAVPIAMPLLNPDGSAPDLTTATIVFKMAQVDGSKVVSGAATLADPTTALVQYQWALGDTSVAGVYRAQWTVTYANSAPETWPVGDTLWIVIAPKL